MMGYFANFFTMQIGHDSAKPSSPVIGRLFILRGQFQLSHVSPSINYISGYNYTENRSNKSVQFLRETSNEYYKCGIRIGCIVSPLHLFGLRGGTHGNGHGQDPRTTRQIQFFSLGGA